MTSDDERVARARAGDLDAFNDLVLEHQAQVYALCYRMLGRREAAEDATQEAFVSAWRAMGTLRGTVFRPWLLRIAANACRDELRRRTRRPSASLDLALEEGLPEPSDSDPSPEEGVIRGALQAEIERALLQLPEEQRLAVLLCDSEGLDYTEIAAVMKTSLGTVKSRIARGRARLRELLVRDAELLPARFRPEE